MICSFTSEFPRIILIWPHRINWVQDSLSYSLPLKKRHCFLPTSQLQQQSGIISVWWSFVSRLQSLVLWNGNSLACKGPRIWQLTSWTFLNCNSTESKSISSASYSNSICWGEVVMAMSTETTVLTFFFFNSSISWIKSCLFTHYIEQICWSTGESFLNSAIPDVRKIREAKAL